MVENSAQLTADEEKLYDRQIRLWGIESQKRLRSARLLLIGLGGLGAEVAKNIVLSGIKLVTLLDDKPSTKDLAFSQFLIPPEKIGENRAEASVERAQNLNPHVEVTSETFRLSDLTEEYFSSSRWDVVVATGLDQDQLERLDGFCRKGKLNFFAGEVFGMFGYFFTDLNTHPYTKTVKTIPKKGVVKEETIKETCEFPTFSSTINHTFQKNSSQLRLLDPSYLVLKRNPEKGRKGTQRGLPFNHSAIETDVKSLWFCRSIALFITVLLKFRAEKKMNPTASDEDFDHLILLRDQELDKHQHPREKVPDEFLQAVVGAEVGPVCAIVGAVLSQEIIKAVSHKDEPHNNMFFFNPLNNKGTVQQLGKLQS